MVMTMVLLGLNEGRGGGGRRGSGWEWWLSTWHLPHSSRFLKAFVGRGVEEKERECD